MRGEAHRFKEIGQGLVCALAQAEFFVCVGRIREKGLSAKHHGIDGVEQGIGDISFADKAADANFLSVADQLRAFMHGVKDDGDVGYNCAAMVEALAKF